MSNETSIPYPAYRVEGADRSGPWVVTCDHATNSVPPFVSDGDLGLSHEDMNRHIAYDVGGAGVTNHLAKLLNAPAVLSNFSRLVIDPNRGEDDPTLIMQIYDGTIIPGNSVLTEPDREERLERLYRPYHRAVAKHAQDKEIYVAVHSFTPQLSGRPPRPWHIGVLFADDDRFSCALLDRLAKETDLVVGANEPYSGKLKNDSVDQHALRFGRHNALLEIRNDLIETAEDQIAWAERLAPILEDTRQSLQIAV